MNMVTSLIFVFASLSWILGTFYCLFTLNADHFQRLGSVGILVGLIIVGVADMVITLADEQTEDGKRVIRFAGSDEPDDAVGEKTKAFYLEVYLLGIATLQWGYGDLFIEALETLLA